jgi:hypothetical protein
MNAGAHQNSWRTGAPASLVPASVGAHERCDGLPARIRISGVGQKIAPAVACTGLRSADGASELLAEQSAAVRYNKPREDGWPDGKNQTVGELP